MLTHSVLGLQASLYNAPQLHVWLRVVGQLLPRWCGRQGGLAPTPVT